MHRSGRDTLPGEVVREEARRLFANRDGFVLVETLYSDEELPATAPRPPGPGMAGTTSVVVDSRGNIAAEDGTERPPMLLSVSDGCRHIVVSGTGFEPSNAQIEWLEGLITARLADPETVGHDFCQTG